MESQNLLARICGRTVTVLAWTAEWPGFKSWFGHLSRVQVGMLYIGWMLRTYQFKTQCKGDIHSSKTANIILPGVVTEYRWTPLRVNNNRIEVQMHDPWMLVETTRVTEFEYYFAHTPSCSRSRTALKRCNIAETGSSIVSLLRLNAKRRFGAHYYSSWYSYY